MRQRQRYEQRVGTTVDARWRIDALLGCGSTSAVYAATHRNGHRAALKIIHQSLCADAALTQRFLREAGIANAIKHRAIVPIGDDGITEDGCAYLVLELLEGETLEEIRARSANRIPLQELAPIADELMSAISAVHTAGIVHRDLKPGNVFITKGPTSAGGATASSRGRLKLLDFGTARIFDREMDSTLSAAGLVMGTPAYMSPEQARGARAEVDAQSDVWSLGAMIFTLLTGEHVHVGKDSHQQLLMAAMRPARFVSDADRTIDHRVAAAIDRALAYAKKDRWSDVHSLRVAFRDAVVASTPAMRDLKAFVDDSGTPPEGVRGVLSDDTVRDVTAIDGDDESLPKMESFSSDRTLVMANPALPGVHSDPVRTQGSAGPTAASASEGASLVTPYATVVPVDAVSATQGARRTSRGIPIPALLVGTAAMAAAIALVVFFMTSGDDARSHVTAAAPALPTLDTAAAPAIAAPVPSLIEITAPDVPVTSASAAKPKPVAAVAPAGGAARRASVSAPASTSVSSTADAGHSPANQESAAPPAKSEGAPATLDPATTFD
jgi:serine/threonine-protein kinase